MKWLLWILLILLCSDAYAGQYSIQVPSNLTDAQLAQIQASANNMVANNTSSSMPQSIAEWKEISEILSDSLISTAQKLGITVNEFASTGVGKLLTLVLLWNYLGQSLIHYIFGFLWLFTMVPLWLHMYKKYCFDWKEEKLTEDGKTVLYQNIKAADGDKQFFFWLSLVLLIIIGIVAIFTG